MPPGYPWVPWAPLYCHGVCDHARQVPSEQHPPFGAEKCFFQKQEDEGPKYHRFHISKITAFPACSYIQHPTGCRETRIQCRKRESPPGCLHPEQLTHCPTGKSSPTSQQEQNTFREENKANSSISSIGSTFISSEEKQSDQLGQLQFCFLKTFPNISHPTGWEPIFCRQAVACSSTAHRHINVCQLIQATI